jgi:hypothetical protein
MPTRRFLRSGELSSELTSPLSLVPERSRVTQDVISSELGGRRRMLLNSAVTNRAAGENGSELSSWEALIEPLVRVAFETFPAVAKKVCT